MYKKKTPLEELDLAKKLKEEANRKVAEARRKLKIEKEKETLKLAKKIMKMYGTSDLEELKEKILAENSEVLFEFDSSEFPQEFPDSEVEFLRGISQDDYDFLTTTANRIKNEKHVQYPEIFEEIERRFAE
jgi:hypothetical protein